MDRMDYIQAVTRTRVLETKLLSRTRIERMVDAKDIEEVLKILGETEYSNAISGVNKPQDYEKILSFELKRIYKDMYEIAKDKIVLDLLALKYDYHNLKLLVKEKLLGKDFGELYIPIGIGDIQKVRTDYQANNFRDMDERFKVALQEVEKDFETNEDSQRIDIILDKHYFNHIYQLSLETEIPLFINYTRDLIDFTNLRTLIRVKKQQKDMKFLEEVVVSGGNIGKDEIILSLNDSIEAIVAKFRSYDISPNLKLGLESYQQTGRLSEFEKQMDDYLMDLNKPSKFINFGPEPIFSYVIAKETEIKILRIIMVSKLNKLSPEDIRERLRDLYV